MYSLTIVMKVSVNNALFITSAAAGRVQALTASASLHHRAQCARQLYFEDVDYVIVL